MSDFDAIAFAARQTFRRAKSLTNPHEYIVRHKVRESEGNDDGFDDLIRHIHRHGVEMAWGGKIWIMWYASDGYHYWTMGWPLKETIIINRSLTETEHRNKPVVDETRYSSPDGRRPVL